MAKVLFGNGIADARRSIAGNTFSRNKGGSYMRQRVKPINPQTIDQVNKREILSALSKLWGNTLTQTQRDGWQSFAELNPRVDVLGQVIILSGIQMYISINERLLIAGAARIDGAPLNQQVTQLTAVSAVFDVGLADSYEITFAPPIVGDERLQISATPQLSPGISFIKNRVRLIVAGESGATSPDDVLARWQTKFGAKPIVGAKVVSLVSVINELNGAKSVPIRADTIVIST